MMIEDSKAVNVYDNRDITDANIWLSIKKGNKKALEILFTRHYDDLYRYANKICTNGLAEDCIQDVFIKIWRQRSELGEVKNVKTYLWKTVRNSIISKLRKKNRRKRILNSSKSEIEPELQLNSEELLIKEESDILKKRRLRMALKQLSYRQHEVLYLKFYEGMSYDEIEQIMDISYQTTRNYVCKALQTLKCFFKNTAASNDSN